MNGLRRCNWIRDRLPGEIAWILASCRVKSYYLQTITSGYIECVLPLKIGTKAWSVIEIQLSSEGDRRFCSKRKIWPFHWLKKLKIWTQIFKYFTFSKIKLQKWTLKIWKYTNSMNIIPRKIPRFKIRIFWIFSNFKNWFQPQISMTSARTVVLTWYLPS